MSAFLCSAAHLSALVHAAKAVKCDLLPAPPGATDAEWTFTILLDENLESLTARYGSAHGFDPAGFKLSRRPPALSASGGEMFVATIAKLINSYEYQSCEHDGWQTSDAKRWCDDLRDALLRALPSYETAPWTI